MTFSASLSRCALTIFLCALACGCVPPSQSPIEDEKEPHFIEGQHALNSYDYTGAIAEFEKAVEANPRNASAHFKLGWLYEKPDVEPDPAAAIYHYQQFLKLRPTADIAEAVRLRIMNCKQDLAKGVLPLPSSPSVQHDLEVLVQSNKQFYVEVEQWRAWYRAQQTNRTPQQTAVPVPQVQQTQTVQSIDTAQSPMVRSNSPPQTLRVAPHISSRPITTYVVQARDTFASISRMFNVKMDALAAANPGVDARRLRPGQVLNIP